MCLLLRSWAQYGDQGYQLLCFGKTFMHFSFIFKEIYYVFTKNFIEHNFFYSKSYKKMSKGRPRRTLILFELFKIEIRANWRFFLRFSLRLSPRAVLAVRPTLQMIALASFHRDGWRRWRRKVSLANRQMALFGGNFKYTKIL